MPSASAPGSSCGRSTGAEFGQQYFAGYLIEKSLAVDNVFIWAIIFTYFAVPRQYQHRVLFFGVLGALVFRGIFIAAGSAIIASAGWVLYFFAAFLLVTGYRMLRQRNSHLGPGEVPGTPALPETCAHDRRLPRAAVPGPAVGALLATPRDIDQRAPRGRQRMTPKERGTNDS